MMSILLSYNVKYIHTCRFHHLLTFSACNASIYSNVKVKFPANKQYLKHKIQKRKFSWTGFYVAISESAPVISLQNALIDLHNFFAVPWWMVIMLTTLTIRSVFIFPLAVHQNQVIARLANLNIELGKLAPELNKEVNIAKKLYNWDEVTARKVFKRNMQNYYHKFIIRDNCHPFKTVLLALFQVPVWICFSFALRNLTYLPSALNPEIKYVRLQLETEGILWFTNLTMPDHFVIPLLLCFVNLTLIEIHALRRIGKRSLLQGVLLNTSRVVTLAVAVAAAANPSISPGSAPELMWLDQRIGFRESKIFRIWNMAFDRRIWEPADF
ncbi:cytochrome c oxidase assembly protein COX18, mitochondrial-like isoform X2 [Stegodyphus dumicola]|uniref:cytochrome c oxidase assembly protein COX18, mitochondrial-like isoform X2 n=1 Tax=Stegodyphus dumicola TaxID=202533 RepID=UPI0015AD9C7E|nr:cytochrome c oxidase assembly protein COX18, mitochondrial-like isoform X2 [Stegodyphus dumicola]